MSRRLAVATEPRQTTLSGFMAKKHTTGMSLKSSSVFSASNRMLTENGQSIASGTTNGAKSKFKYVNPVKRKSESLIEISDDSRSPSKFENPASKRPHILDDSDDDIFVDEVREKTIAEPKRDDDYEKRIAALYAKYDSPKKDEPIKTNTKAIQLTPEDKLDLDQALNANDKYTTAQKRLDDDLRKVQQSSQLLTTKTGVGKFKFARPRTSTVLSVENTATIPSPTTLPTITKPIETPATMTNAIKPMNATSNGPTKRYSPATTSSTAMQPVAKSSCFTDVLVVEPTPKPTPTTVTSTMTR